MLYPCGDAGREPEISEAESNAWRDSGQKCPVCGEPLWEESADGLSRSKCRGVYNSFTERIECAKCVGNCDFRKSGKGRYVAQEPVPEAEKKAGSHSGEWDWHPRGESFGDIWGHR